MDLEERLGRIGIAGTSYKVYVAAMVLGTHRWRRSLPAREVARTTAYDALAKLQADGLIALEERQGRRFVVAHEPNVLLEKAEARRQVLNDLLPSLRSIYNSGSGRPRVEFHPGPDGIKRALWDTLTGEDSLLRATFAMSEIIDTPGLDELASYFVERRRKEFGCG